MSRQPKQTVYEMNLVRLVEEFGSEDKCRAHLESLRWPDGVVCPRCASRKISRISDRAQFDCDSCRFQFSVTSGTMFHDTHLPLWKWFLAVYMIVEAKKGVSANQLKRTLKVSYRTAWYLCHRVRAAMETPDGLLRGVVEIDETYCGGKRRAPKRKDGSKGLPRGYDPLTGKTMVMGAVERGGNIRIHSEPGRRPNVETLRRFIRDNVEARATVYTDDHHAYPSALKGHASVHQSVNHSGEEWVRGDVHTNTLEGAWGLFKRSVVGSYHQLSVKHLDAYLDEFEFRYNNRKNPQIFRDALCLLLGAEHLEYRVLVEGESDSKARARG